MRPILFSLFGVDFPSWTVFLVLGFVAAYFYAAQLLKSTDDQKCLAAFPRMFVICYVSGWFGSRALSIFVDQFDVVGPVQFLQQLVSFGPMTFYGGFILASVAGVLFVLWAKLPFLRMVDACFPAVVLGLGIGRIGCHLNGDDFGQPIQPQYPGGGSPWWSVTFPNLQDSVARYPTQLQEALVSFIIVIVATIYWKKFARRWPGLIGLTCVGLSAANRIVNEMFRGDARGVFPGTLMSVSQGISVVLILICVALGVRWVGSKSVVRN